MRLVRRWLHGTGSLLRISAPGYAGLTMYWAIMIGIILVSAYLVGDLIPNRFSPPDVEQELIPIAPTFTDARSSLQLRTFTFRGCRSAASVQFLLDVSNSMDNIEAGSSRSKLASLQNALRLYGRTAKDNSVVGMITFNDTVREELPMGIMGEVRQDYAYVTDSLTGSGFTFIRDGMERAARSLQEAKAKFPNHDHILIMVSDGIPQSAQEQDRCRSTPNSNGCMCRAGACFYAAQDPTRNPNVAQRIKDMGVKIYTIGIQSATEAAFRTEYNNLLSGVASSPSNRYFIRANRADDLSQIFAGINQKICDDIEGTQG